MGKGVCGTRPHVARAGLKLTAILSEPLQGWDYYECALLYLPCLLTELLHGVEGKSLNSKEDAGRGNSFRHLLWHLTTALISISLFPLSHLQVFFLTT